LSRPAKLAGLAWLSTGLVYGVWKKQAFRRSVELVAPRDEPLIASPTPRDVPAERDQGPMA
jgi:hypothetical protein